MILLDTVKLVFSNHKYIVISSIIFVGLVIPLLIISEYIFLEPYLVGYISEGRELGFALIIAVSAMSGLVLSMNIYRIRLVTKTGKNKLGNGIIGSFVGSIAGACGCGPIGFSLISTFGTIGGITTSFLTFYEIPIRLGALVILFYTFYITARSLSIQCKIQN